MKKEREETRNTQLETERKRKRDNDERVPIADFRLFSSTSL